MILLEFKIKLFISTRKHVHVTLQRYICEIKCSHCKIDSF